MNCALRGKEISMQENANRRLVVVSNRLPIAVTRENDKLVVKQGAGGLVTALSPVLQNRGGLWIGWPGTSEKGLDKLFRDFSRYAGYLLQPVALDERDIQDFYYGFSNEILWPLFHEFQMPCNFLPAYWDAYLCANMKFAQAVAKVSREEDFIWVHDYHLMLVAKQLKELGTYSRIGFFLHIPFPPADIFCKIPWRRQLVDALLEYDLLGFQTLRDRGNFFEVVKRLYPKASKRGRGQVITLSVGRRRLRLGAFPISIDFRAFANAASQPESKARAAEIRAAFGNCFLLFGADRLDYTKGIPQRFDALKLALETYPELIGKISLMQVLVPSREEVPQYQSMKVEIERMVGEINGRFSTPGWLPIHFTYRNIPREELVSYYQAADMALVTPLRDGMNLVAKEYAACNVSEKGVLCLSEFAGAAMELHRYAVMINPFDVVGMAKAIHDGMTLDAGERRRKMHAIRNILRRYDIFWWVDAFLEAAFSTHLANFPQREPEYWEELESTQGPPWDLERLENVAL